MSGPDLYLLIHPERFPLLDGWEAVAGYGESELLAAHYDEADSFERAYGQLVSERARVAARAWVLLDELDLDTLYDDAAMADIPLADETPELLLAAVRERSDTEVEVTVGAPLALFDRILEGGSLDIARVARQVAAELGEGTRVLLGGFHRADCVARAAQTLRRHGLDAEVCPVSTLPLASLEPYLHTGAV